MLVWLPLVWLPLVWLPLVRLPLVRLSLRLESRVLAKPFSFEPEQLQGLLLVWREPSPLFRRSPASHLRLCHCWKLQINQLRRAG